MQPPTAKYGIAYTIYIHVYTCIYIYIYIYKSCVTHVEQLFI